MSNSSSAALRLVALTGLFFLLAGAPASGQTKPIRLRNETITTEPSPPGGKVAGPKAAELPRSGLILIQFEGPLQAAWRAELRQRQVILLQYVPEDAFIARAVNVIPSDLRQLPYVRWVGDYRADHKVHTTLRAKAALQAQEQAVSIVMAPDATPAEATATRQQLRGAGPPARYPFGTVLRGNLPAGQLDLLAASDKVLWIEPAPKMKLQDEVSSAIVAGTGSAPNETMMMELGFNGAGVTVSVADSGLDSGDTSVLHPDLAGRVSALFYYGDPGQLQDAADEHGHGTHVAGIIAGNAATGEKDESGYLYGLGVAPGASLIAQRIFDGAGNYAPPPSYETLTRDATRAGADIGSNSWGDDTQGRYDVSAMEFDALVRDADRLRQGDQPYILEFSAGNAGPGSGTIGSPAVAKNVIATGAANSDRRNLPMEEFAIYSDGPDTMADFSSRGPCEDGRIKPDVTAPGTWISSARSIYANDDNAWWPISDYYFYMGGTSQAGPHASGAAAVFVQYYRATHTNATPSPALVKAALINSATDMDDAVETGPVPNMDEGWGRLYLPTLIGGTRDYQLVEQGKPLTNGAVFERRVVVGNPEEPFKVTLAYTDVPGFAGAVPALVNDLDLEVLGPDGQLYRGNQFDQGESVSDLAGTDSINNVEAVHLLTPVPGEYLVRVRATHVVQDARSDTPELDQDFALVISAGFAAPGVGIVTFDRAAYTAPSTIKLSLVDYDLAGQATASVVLRSTTEPAGETITLHASSSTGIFTAAVAAVTGPATTDGRLQVSHGDLIEAIYQDAHPAGTRTFTATVDLHPPVISNVTASNSFGQVVISWQTDEEASGIILYGTTTLNLAVTNRFRDVTHEVQLTGVVPNVTYHFVVICQDEAGNWSTNNNGGLYFTFTAVQPPGILLVDSFADYLGLFMAPPLSGYTDALNQLGVAYDVFDATSGATPTLTQLLGYRSVIWRVSDLEPPSTTLAQNITNYLKSGGTLLITSMEALSRFDEAGLSTFRANILQVKSYTADQPVNNVNGVPSDPVGAGINAVLDYTPYEDILLLAGTEDPSDWIVPTTNGAPVLVSTDDASEPIVGVRSPKAGVDLPWRVVFLSFPLDAVPLGTGIGNNRAGLLHNILSFLAPQPGNSSLTLDSDVYSLPGRAVVEVEDVDLAGQDHATVTFYSPEQTSGVPVTLHETVRHGLFRGTVFLSSSNTGASGVLVAQTGDTIQASYLDASSGQTLIATATIETTPPALSNLSVDPGYLEAIVSWNTSEPADALVQYSDSPFSFPDNFTAYDGTLDVIHDVVLTGLQPNRTYYFRVVSRDRAGNTATDDNQGQLYTFHTLQPAVPPWQDDMEALNPEWSTYKITDSETDWTWGAPGGGETAHSGTHCWGSNLGGGPLNQAECYLISPGILLTGGNHATLRFWHNYDFSLQSELDLAHIGAVEIITNIFEAPQPIQQYFDLSGGWVEEEGVDLTPYLGQVVYIAWYYALLSFDFESTSRLGWLVDDVSITVDYVAPGTVQVTNNIAQAFYSLSGPVRRDGQGRWLVVTNAPAGRYVVDFGDVPYFLTPPSQTNTLEAGGILVFNGTYTFPDANHNGIWDLWEQQYFGAVATTNVPSTLTDQDHDGVSDYAEFVAGTDPTNAASFLKVEAPVAQGSSSWTIQWQAATGRAYRVLASTDAIHWNPMTGWQREAGGPATRTLALPPGTSQYFFRLEVQP